MIRNPNHSYENPESEPLENNASASNSDTLIVPPPDFKERLAAAQRARELQAARALQRGLPTPEPVDPSVLNG
jgi:hypothetical protein